MAVLGCEFRIMEDDLNTMEDDLDMMEDKQTFLKNWPFDLGMF